MANYTQYVERTGENATYSTDLQAFSLAMQAMMSMFPFKSPSILGNYDEGNILNTGALYYKGVLYAPPAGLSYYPEGQYLYAVAAWDDTSERSVIEQTQQITYKQRITYYQEVRPINDADVNNGDGTGSWLIGQITLSNLNIWRRGIFGDDPSALMPIHSLSGDTLIDNSMDGSVIQNYTLDGKTIMPNTLPSNVYRPQSIPPTALAQLTPQTIVNNWITVTSASQSYALATLVQTDSNNPNNVIVSGLDASNLTTLNLLINATSLNLKNNPDLIVLPIVLNNKEGLKIRIETGMIGAAWGQDTIVITTQAPSGVATAQLLHLIVFKRMSSTGYTFLMHNTAGAVQQF